MHMHEYALAEKVHNQEVHGVHFLFMYFVSQYINKKCTQ